MIDPGELRIRLVIEAPSETPDGAGGIVRGYVAAGSLWASVTPVSARFATVAEAPGATVTHRIIVRAPLTISTRHRLRDEARVWRIVSVRESDATARTLLIEAEERRD